MDWLTFISNIFSSIIWPITIIIVVLFLKSPISKLIPLLRKFKYREFELTFEEELKDLRNQIEIVSKQGEKEFLPKVEKLSTDFKHLELILDSWDLVKNAVEEVGKRHNVKLTSESFTVAAAELEQKGILSLAQANILLKLRELRNRAIHAKGTIIEYKHSKEFTNSAKDFIKILERI